MSGHIDQAANLGATNRVEQNGRRVRQNNVSVIRVRKLAILQVQDHTNKMRHNIYLQRMVIYIYKGSYFMIIQMVKLVLQKIQCCKNFYLGYAEILSQVGKASITYNCKRSICLDILPIFVLVLNSFYGSFFFD